MQTAVVIALNILYILLFLFILRMQKQYCLSVQENILLN
jgi:hypothetical protein